MQWYNGMSGGRRIGGNEIGRNDSVSKTPCAEKLFLICGSYQTSRDFNNVMGTPQFFMELIKRGPSASGLGKDVWFFIPTKECVVPAFVVCAYCFNFYKRFVSDWLGGA